MPRVTTPGCYPRLIPASRVGSDARSAASTTLARYTTSQSSLKVALRTVATTPPRLPLPRLPLSLALPNRRAHRPTDSDFLWRPRTVRFARPASTRVCVADRQPRWNTGQQCPLAARPFVRGLFAAVPPSTISPASGTPAAHSQSTVGFLPSTGPDF